jgi:hypothetical protein
MRIAIRNFKQNTEHKNVKFIGKLNQGNEIFSRNVVHSNRHATYRARNERGMWPVFRSINMSCHEQIFVIKAFENVH